MADVPLTSSAESTPLLAPRQAPLREANADLHDLVLSELDSSYSHDDVHDHPPTPNVHRVRTQLSTAATAPGHGHPAASDHHLASPALLLRLRQSVDHGFHTIWKAVLNSLKPHRSNNSSNAQSSRAKRYTLVRSVFIIAFLTMLSMTSLSPTLLLFMNEATFTSPTHITPYVTASALATTAPIVSNILLTSLASHFGPGRALAVGAMIAAFGMVLVVLSRGILALFYIGYTLYSMCNSLRIVRVSLLSKIVPPEERTTVLATHALMTPVGALVGPTIWIIAQNYRGSFRFLDWIVVDRFTLTYMVTISSFLIIALIALSSLQHLVAYTNNNSQNDDQNINDSGADHDEGFHYGDVIIRFSDGHSTTVNLQRYRNKVFVYFCCTFHFIPAYF